MADTLDYAVALGLARQLKAIPNFPWDEEVIAAHAEHLMRWCRGAILPDSVWPAEAQAHWLVTEAQEKWEKWLGTGALKAMFEGKFPAKKAARPNEFVPRGPKPPVECASCNDFGTVRDSRGTASYCDCEQGARMEADRGASWLEILNAGPASHRRSFPTGPSAQQIDAEFRAAQRRISDEIREAEAILANEDSGECAKADARELIATYRGEKRKVKKKAGAKTPWQV
jgi:hypothetical protein